MDINTGNRINIMKLVAHLHYLRIEALLRTAVFFNRAQVPRRGCLDAGIELAQHRQTQLLDRPVFVRVGEFCDVAQRHGSLGSRVLVVLWFGQIYRVIVGVHRRASARR